VIWLGGVWATGGLVDRSGEVVGSGEVKVMDGVGLVEKAGRSGGLLLAKMGRGVGLLVVMGVLLGVLAGCGRVAADSDATATPAAEEAGTAERRPTVDRSVERVVTADGALVLPVPPQALSFPVAGTVLEVAVTEGQDVAQGDVLARVDLLPFDMAVVDAEAALASAEDALASAEEDASASEISGAQAELAAAEAAQEGLASGTDLERGRLEVERAKNTRWGLQAQRDSICGAADRGFADEASCDSAQANVQAAEQGVQIAEQSLLAMLISRDEDLAAAAARAAGARATLAQLREGPSAEQLAALRARVKQASMALASAQADRGRAVLTAPFDGTITAVQITSGVRTLPGSPVVTLAKTHPLRFATSNLTERNVGDIREGANASVVLTAYPDQALEARVQRISAQARETTGGAVVFTVYLTLDAADLPLRAGMTGRVEITVGADS